MTTPPSKINIGLGLRAPHYSFILENQPNVSWFEAISENYMGIESDGSGGPPLRTLEKIRETCPIVLHGVSLSIGSSDELNFDYLSRLKALINRVEPEWISDHICWTGVGGENLHDLLPLPHTQEALFHLSDRIKRVQDFLGRRMIFENVTSYLSYSHSEMTEWDFLTELTASADCDLLLDINNIYVSSINQNFDPVRYLSSIPQTRVRQMHLAGHSKGKNGSLIDTHSEPVADEVWRLYEEAVKLFPAVPTLIEWDDKLPSFDRLMEEALRAKKVWEGAL